MGAQDYWGEDWWRRWTATVYSRRVRHQMQTGCLGVTNATTNSLTMANQMLSLIGSLQPDPFAPEHVPSATRPDDALEEEALHPRGLRPALVVDENGDAVEAEDNDEELPDTRAVAAAAEARREQEEKKREKQRKKDAKDAKRKSRDTTEPGREEGKKRKKANNVILS
jgi:DNA-directed RNA polymerase I subunit RPA43